MVYKVSENPSDDLEYWLTTTQPTATSAATLPGASDTTKEEAGPESLDDSERLTSVG